MKIALLLVSVLCIFSASTAYSFDGVLVRCGASSGYAHFFKDAVNNPNDAGWSEDKLSTGKIILVKLGEEWDIQFDDALGSTGYRQDGAKVFPLISKPGMLQIGAFNDSYVDIYTFDLENKVVAWSSNKLGPIVPKVAVYSALCE